ncbi:MAG TPA: hypothetical protein VF665_21255, partial [Longimicrobium sp.]|uniref:hypothetical protein n=1 Tax=Longimicrobium sp. TaxID=2029185 RepID=UPI002ED95684
ISTLQGDRWSAPRTVASGRELLVNWADFPTLTAMPGGRMAAHWLQKSPGNSYSYDIRVAVSPDGGVTWSRGATPHRDGAAAEHGFVSLWPEAADSAGMVWLDGRKYAGGESKETMLMTASIRPDGSVGPERPVDGRICDCCQTGMAMTARGPLVVYRDRSPDEVRDIYVTRRVNGVWTPGVPVARDGWKIDACPVNGPRADAQSDRVVVAWFTGADSVRQVKVAYSADAGATFGAPVRVDGGNPEGHVDVKMVEGGAALVSWMERAATGSGGELRVRRIEPDGRLGAPRSIAASAKLRTSGFPRMARDGDGVVLAWTAAGDPSSVSVARLTVPRD